MKNNVNQNNLKLFSELLLLPNTRRLLIVHASLLNTLTSVIPLPLAFAETFGQKEVDVKIIRNINDVRDYGVLTTII